MRSPGVLENVDQFNQVLPEYGHYDYDTAHLDEESTEIYEMQIGLSEYASAVTGYPPGVTTHVSLADTILKDNRIPPRGFDNAAYEAGGTPVVGTTYADGRYRDDTNYWIPDGAVRAEATVCRQTVTRHYIQALRDGNVTDHWGQTPYKLWPATNKAPPVSTVTEELPVRPFVRFDADGDSDEDLFDFSRFMICYSGSAVRLEPGCECMDSEGHADVDLCACEIRTGRPDRHSDASEELHRLAIDGRRSRPRRLPHPPGAGADRPAPRRPHRGFRGVSGRDLTRPPSRQVPVQTEMRNADAQPSGPGVPR